MKEAILGGFDAGLFGRLFGRGGEWAAYGAVAGLFQAERSKFGHAVAASTAPLERIAVLDEIIASFFSALDSGGEGLFDWAATKTFGGRIDLELVRRTTETANEKFRSTVLPLVPELSVYRVLSAIQAKAEPAKAGAEQETHADRIADIIKKCRIGNPSPGCGVIVFLLMLGYSITGAIQENNFTLLIPALLATIERNSRSQRDFAA